VWSDSDEAAGNEEKKEKKAKADDEDDDDNEEEDEEEEEEEEVLFFFTEICRISVTRCPGTDEIFIFFHGTSETRLRREVHKPTTNVCELLQLSFPFAHVPMQTTQCRIKRVF
jgi:hypothetical protein